MADIPERAPSNNEVEVKPSDAAAEQLEKLTKSPESRVELSPRDAEQTAERARVEALENAISVEAGSKESQKQKHAAPTRKRNTISKADKKASFKRHMKDVQKELPVPSRVFSKVIHNKFVEKTSDVVGGTIARPNAVLAGAISAFILTLAVYIVAKTIGYELSGFESIAAFVIGWILGILYDYFRVLITGKK